MDKLTVALCDDDPVFRTLLRASLESAFTRLAVEAVIVETGSAAELSSVIGHRWIDLIFLDIEMPGVDGIRFGEELRALGCRSDIIYVSNMEDRVYDIFRIHPWSFIRKSRYAEELDTVLEEYIRSRRIQDGPLLLQTENGETISLEPLDLLYVEAAGKHQKLFRSDAAEPILVRTSLRELEEYLVPHGFIRVHKGFLVNYRIIRKITSRSVILDSGQDLPIGRDRLKSARESYLNLMKWKGLSRTS